MPLNGANRDHYLSTGTTKEKMSELGHRNRDLLDVQRFQWAAGQ